MAPKLSRTGSAIAALALALVAVNSSGCGLLFAGSTTEVTLETDPPGAAVYIDGQPYGQTPLIVEVDNHKSHIVTFHLGDGAPAACHLTASVAVGWVLLDVMGALIPVLVDALTDGWTTLDQHACYARLSAGASEPRETPVASGDP